MSLLSMLDNTVAIEPPLTTRGSSGSYVTTYPAPADGLEEVPCMVDPHHGKLEVRFGQKVIRMTHTVYFDGENPGVYRGYRLTDEKGKHYIVHGMGDSAGKGRVFAVNVEEQP
jgi:hypothetical protein